MEKRKVRAIAVLAFQTTSFEVQLRGRPLQGEASELRSQPLKVRRSPAVLRPVPGKEKATHKIPCPRQQNDLSSKLHRITSRIYP